MIPLGAKLILSHISLDIRYDPACLLAVHLHGPLGNALSGETKMAYAMQ